MKINDISSFIGDQKLQQSSSGAWNLENRSENMHGLTTATPFIVIFFYQLLVLSIEKKVVSLDITGIMNVFSIWHGGL